jgi:hypothetical protein
MRMPSQAALPREEFHAAGTEARPWASLLRRLTPCFALPTADEEDSLHSLHTGAVVSSIAPRWGREHDESEDVFHGRGCCFGSSVPQAIFMRRSAWSADRLSDLSWAQVDRYGLRRHHEGIASSASANRSWTDCVRKGEGDGRCGRSPERDVKAGHR